jgi:hypothetical protein
MTEWGREDLRRFVTHVLDAFVAALDQQYAGKPVSADELRRIARVVETSAALEPSINATYNRLKDEAAKEFMRNRRIQPFKRLVVHPLTELFESGALGRDILPNYFNFLHLVLGDETEALARLTVTICKDEHHEDGVDWDHFYEDERAKYVLWTCLVRIASSFRKFDSRREWFINLMQNRQHATSIAANAFVPLPVDNEPEEPHPFGPEHFNLMFAALFGPLRKFSIEDEAHFAEAMQMSPAQAFGEMWSNLERTGAQL